MIHEKEILFFKKIMNQFRLKTHLITNTNPFDEQIDLGLRKFLGMEEDYEHTFLSLFLHLQSNTIYHMTDIFFCHYVFILLSEKTEETRSILAIGPYTTQDNSKQDIYKAIEKYNFSPALIERLLQFYANVTLISDTSALQALLSAFAETLWESECNYTFQDITHTLSQNFFANIPAQYIDSIPETTDISYKMELLEKRYEAENRFMNNIAMGNYHKAELSFETGTLFSIEKRLDDPVRNFKNYCITMNTLLRKAAEHGAVHPIHIDRISSDFAKKIETVTSPESGKKLMQEMIRKYGLLVKNHSMRDYSWLVQKVVTRIDSDLSADQSLNTHAKILNVSPSYLSTLFRKDTGLTLTEYVNRKRIEYGILLLNTTNLQIQTIALHCGIPDINYFTRIFKKYIGITPKDYRKSLGK